MEGKPHQIIVLGETGAGKSTFVNKLLGREGAMKVGESLQGCTHGVHVANMKHSGRSFDVVDTPGFDDGSNNWPDSRILRILADWLRETHRKNKIAAIIYIHDISRPVHKPTFWTIKDLCGEDSFSNIIIVTTKWDKGNASANQVNLNTEAYLKRDTWGALIRGGATTFRWSHTDPVDNVLDYISLTLKSPINELKIQNEMNNQRKRLEETSAGRHVGIRKIPWWTKLRFKFFWVIFYLRTCLLAQILDMCPF